MASAAYEIRGDWLAVPLVMCNVSLKTSLSCYEGLQDDATPVRSIMGFVFPGVNINACILHMPFQAIFVPQFWSTCLPIARHPFPEKHCFW